MYVCIQYVDYIGYKRLLTILKKWNTRGTCDKQIVYDLFAQTLNSCEVTQSEFACLNSAKIRPLFLT